jgi:UDPglucose--hexose-1-phosphate uridylyltransferase
VTEIPLADFEAVVFENRFPAFVTNVSLRETGVQRAVSGFRAPARGASEVLVYTPEHTGSLATLPSHRRELLVQVWIDRYLELYRRPEVRYVLPFENRGEEVGVTLHHPHGQIYAYPFVPPVVVRELAAFATGNVLGKVVEQLSAEYVIASDDYALAFVPPFARFPYEVWIAPRQPHPGPWTFSAAEITSFAYLLGEVVRRYDSLFGRPLPYVMVLHAGPRHDTGLQRPIFHFHVEFYPFRRGPDRLKFLAGTELGAGVFTVDVLPEEAAQRLREAAGS